MRIDVAGWLANAEGSLQTPRGGGIGTTSPDRPTLREIGLGGLHLLPCLDVGLDAVFLGGRHELRVHYDRVDFGGSEGLGAPLTSQDQLFPGGASVESHLRLSLLRVGYRAFWLPPLPEPLHDWRLVPELGLAFTPFHYQLRSRAATGAVDRSYGVAYPYYGFSLAGPMWRRLDLELEVLGAGGINHVGSVDSQLQLVWHVLETSHARVSLLLGLGGSWLRRDDKQDPVANTIDVRLGSFSSEPWAGFRFGSRFEF